MADPKLTEVDEELDLSGLTPADEELDLSAAEAPAPSQAEGEEPSALESIGRGLGQGFTFKAGDEISGGIGALIYGSNLQDDERPGEGIIDRMARGYRESRDQERRANAAAKAANPKLYGASVGLGMAPGAIAAGLGGTALGLGRAGMAGLGALGGGTQAFYGSEGDVVDQLKDTGVGAATGAVTGAFPITAIPAAGYGLATGDSADRAEALTSLLAGGLASRVGAKRGQKLEAGRKARAEAVEAAQAPDRPKMADLETDIRASGEKLAAEEAQVRQKILESDVERQNAAAKAEAAGRSSAAKRAAAEEQAASQQASKQAKAEQAARESEAVQKAQQEALDLEAAEQTQFEEGSRAQAEFEGRESTAQKALKDFLTQSGKTANALERETGRRAKELAGFDEEMAGVEASRKDLEASAKGLLGREWQRDYDMLRSFESVPDDALTPAALARRNELKARIADVANRRFEDLTPEERVAAFRKDTEAKLARKESEIGRRREEAQARQAATPVEVAARRVADPRLNADLAAGYKKGQELGLDVGEDPSQFNPIADYRLKGERPAAPKKINKAEQKARANRLKLEAIKAARAGKMEQARELAAEARAVEEAPVAEATFPIGGEGPMTERQTAKQNLEMGPKRVSAGKAQEKARRDLSDLRERSKPEAIVARGKEQAKSAAEADRQARKVTREDLSLNPWKTVRNITSKLLQPAAPRLQTDEARAAFHDAVVKELEAAKVPPKELEAAGRILSAFAAGKISAAALSALLDKEAKEKAP